MMLGILSACAGKPPVVGLVDGKLRPCPNSPNCVCSQGKEDPQHAIEPLRYSGSLADAKQALHAVIEAMARVRFVDEREDYWHVEFTTLILRFVDDVELRFDPQQKEIHIRSASRVGYSDLGVNRKRVETIRRGFDERLAAKPAGR
jgi:uncharacterized protein (DUF1499 family)